MSQQAQMFQCFRKSKWSFKSVQAVRTEHNQSLGKNMLNALIYVQGKLRFFEKHRGNAFFQLCPLYILRFIDAKTVQVVPLTFRELFAQLALSSMQCWIIQSNAAKSLMNPSWTI